MKLNRLFEIIYILLDKKKITAKALAEHFEVSTRTIYRDVEDISSTGIPIYMSKGKNGGISLLPNYVLDKTVLTEKEKNNIISALQSLNTLDKSSVEETLNKVSSFFGDTNQGFYEIDLDDWGSLIKDQFEKSKEAILSRKLLSFVYLSSLNKRGKRIVEPYKLWFKGKNWYLKAFCLNKNEVRIFRFSRMRQVKILEEQFEPRNLDFSINYENSNQTTEIIMKIDSDMEYRVLDEFSEKDVVQNRDGSFTVKMRFIEDSWVYGYILSFGSSAKVISPPEIQNTIQNILQNMVLNYSNNV
ncbi:MAG: YafY family transcriptional regulator [Christensenellaceae bacterium]|nr:YafY family transcriptional regulator [Christensenellaceae bacterium]